ncbi:rubredoxin [Cyanobium sp. ATX 6F1]|nr:rubredoxin [Cyanobium sp. ATX 6F1]MCP9916622.1 rubredoxin [Cyanobium sp. ATX 6F1]
MEAIPQEPALDVPESPIDEPADTAAASADHPEPSPSPGPVIAVEGSSQDAADQVEEDGRDHRFECRSCGFVFDPTEGIRKLGIEPGVAFEDLDPLSFRCPVCRSRVGAFKDIGPRNKPSGFEENLGFGLGVNKLTPGQKNVLIFSAFALAVAFFLSLYSLR